MPSCWATEGAAARASDASSPSTAIGPPTGVSPERLCRTWRDRTGGSAPKHVRQAGPTRSAPATPRPPVSRPAVVRAQVATPSADTGGGLTSGTARAGGFCRSSTFLTAAAVHAPPRGVGTPRAVSAAATWRRLVAPPRLISSTIGSTLAACRSAPAERTAALRRVASGRLVRLPSLTPRALAAASASRVRAEIMARSFSAKANTGHLGFHSLGRRSEKTLYYKDV